MNIKIKDLNINYSIEGEGKNLLLLHGWGCNIETFKSIIANLSIAYKVYAIDLPGFGKSEEPKYAWSIDEYVDLVIEFIKQNNIEELSLLGHSFGGRIIIKMVTRENLHFKVNKIVIMDGAGIKPLRNKKVSFKIRVFKFLKILVSNKLIKKIFPNALNKLKGKFGSADYRDATPMMRDILVKTVNEDLEYLLNKIKEETLLIWGENDDQTPISDAKKMEQLIPNAGLVVVKNVGHFPFLEQPMLVNKVLASFFNIKE